MRRLAVWAAVVAVVTSAQAQSPHAFTGPDGIVRLLLPASSLTRKDIQRQLTNGLTTVFFISAKTRKAPSVAGGARVEVRYELWDEKFVVRTADITARRQDLSHATFDELVAWWSRTPMAVLTRAGEAAEIDVRMDVVPFSEREQQETQEWLSRTIAAGEDAPLHRDLPRPAGASGRNFLDLLIGTSVRQKSIKQFRWIVTVTKEAR